MKQALPEGYDRFAVPYQCLKKGYGACLYANRRGRGAVGRAGCPAGGGRNNNNVAPVMNPIYYNLVVILMLVVVLVLLLVQKK